jgi:hypothetical protein
VRCLIILLVMRRMRTGETSHFQKNLFNRNVSSSETFHNFISIETYEDN